MAECVGIRIISLSDFLKTVKINKFRAENILVNLISIGVLKIEFTEKEVFYKLKEPVKVYRVIAPSTRRTRFDVNAERGLTPFVGREREIELLLDAFSRAKEGRGQAVSIMAEAGVGKSRLLYEFRKFIAEEDVTFFPG